MMKFEKILTLTFKNNHSHLVAVKFCSKFEKMKIKEKYAWELNFNWFFKTEVLIVKAYDSYDMKILDDSY